MKPEKTIACILPFLLCVVSFSIGQVRAIDNKGTIRQIDTSKWKLSGNNIYNKNMGGNVGIGTNTPNARLEIDTTGSTIAALKIKSPFTGTTTDSLLTWNAADGSVRKIRTDSLTNRTAWSLTGNSGTNATALNSPGTNFLGTTDIHSLVFKTNNTLSGYIGTDSTDNLTYGINAGISTTISSLAYNTFIGNNSGHQNTSGSSNTFLGNNSGFSNTTGTSNTFLGRSSGYYNNSGVNNTFLGFMSGHENTIGSNNTFLGKSSGYSNTTGTFNTFLGCLSGHENTIGNNNTFLGFISGYYNTSGNYNTFLGYTSGYYNTQGYNNTFVGDSSGYSNATGNYNAFVGNNSGYNNTTGNYNAFLGTNSGISNTTGNYNTFIGYSSGSTKQTVQYGTFLGYGADATVDALTNVTAIGYNAQAGASNSLVLGGTGTYAVNVGIGTTAPTAKLTIANGTSTKTTLPVLKLDTLFSGNTADSLVVWRASDSSLRKIPPVSVLRANYMGWFYMPSIPVNTSNTGTTTVNLYNSYQTQFATPAVVSSGAPASIPYVPAATSLYYYVTSYDQTVLSNISIDVNGIMTYTVLSTANPASFVNIIFVLK